MLPTIQVWRLLLYLSLSTSSMTCLHFPFLLSLFSFSLFLHLSISLLFLIMLRVCQKPTTKNAKNGSNGNAKFPKMIPPKFFTFFLHLFFDCVRRQSKKRRRDEILQCCSKANFLSDLIVSTKQPLIFFILWGKAAAVAAVAPVSQSGCMWCAISCNTNNTYRALRAQPARHPIIWDGLIQRFASQ